MKKLILIIFFLITIFTIGTLKLLQAVDVPMDLKAKSLTQLQPKDFSKILGMEGFSDTLLNNHFKLYHGYIMNVNLITEKLNVLLGANQDRTLEYAELKRRFSWELNGVLLHEYYFENLGGKEQLNMDGVLYKKIVESFGNFDIWKQDFISTGMMRGIGWVVFYWEERTGKLMNVWIDEHNTGNITCARPLLVMDLFEHAYFTDYQLDKSKYINAFFKNINWNVVEARFNKIKSR